MLSSSSTICLILHVRSLVRLQVVGAFELCKHVQHARVEVCLHTQIVRVRLTKNKKFTMDTQYSPVPYLGSGVE